MGHWRITLEQKPHDVGLGESRSVKLGESAPPSTFQCYRMELRPAAYVMKRGTTPPTQYRTKEAGTTQQAKFLASTIHALHKKDLRR